MTQRVPAEVFPPSEFINEEMEARGWNATSLMQESGLGLGTCLALRVGSVHITPMMAWCLGRALGTSADYWMNLQTAYDARG